MFETRWVPNAKESSALVSLIYGVYSWDTLYLKARSFGRITDGVYAPASADTRVVSCRIVPLPRSPFRMKDERHAQ